MKQYQIRYAGAADFAERLEEIKLTCSAQKCGDIYFYLTWSEKSKDELETVVSQIEKVFPDALYYGNEASGSIADGSLAYGINVTYFFFEAPTSKAELVWVEQGSTLSSMEDLWAYCRSKSDLRAVELIPAIKSLDALKIEGCVPGLKEGIRIFGGASVNYDNPSFEADIIATGHPLTKTGMAVVLYYGRELHFSTSYVLGWKGLGKYLKVTGSEGKCISEIDGRPAYSIYEEYLNLTVEDNDTLVFPLIVEENGIEFIRTPQIINPDKSMQMFASIPVGSHVRISYGDKNTILDSLYAKAKELADFRPEGIKTFSCAARRLFWGDSEVSKETRILQDVAPVFGFYTGGEILKFGDRLRVLNQTLSIVCIRESQSAELKNPVSLKDKDPDKSLVSRLAFFIEKVTAERDTAHEQIVKQQELMRENMAIISGLATEYHALYYFNIDQSFFKVYSIDEQRFPEAKMMVSEKANPIETFQRFGNSPFVHPEDRHVFDDLSIDNLRQRLSHSKKLTYRFRRKFGTEFLWTEMEIVKFEDIDERVNSIVLGFAERDADIRTEQTLQKCYSILSQEITPADAINELLLAAGEHYGAERAYIFEFDENQDVFSNSYEWCAEGIEPMISHLQNIPMKEVTGWVNEFKRKGAFHMDALDSEHNTQEGIAILEMQGIQSLVAAPIMNGDKIVGFVGVDNPTKAKGSVAVLNSVAAVSFSEILKRKETDEENVTLEKLADTFVSVYYADLSRDYMHNWKVAPEYNESFKNVTSYSVTMGGYVRECVAERDRDYCYNLANPAAILEQFKTKDRFSVELTDIMLDHERNFVFDFVKVSEDGNKFVLSCRDVTENLAKEKAQQKQLEEALRAADVANQSKTSFLFNMSHDIRTPMNAITGFTSMAKKYVDNKDKVIDYLDKIDLSGQQLLMLINQVLEMSRIESGKVEFEEKKVNILENYDSLVTILAEQAKVNGLKFHHSLSDITHANILADEARMSQITLNLTGNAIKYTPKGGTIDYHLRENPCSREGYASFTFTVADTGIGMSEEFQKVLFEPFSREKTSTVSKIQGTGLGLSIVKSLVDLLGGTIEVHSELGKGTRFDVTIELKLAEVLKSGKANRNVADSADFTGRRILLVEDNALNREIARFLLEEQGLVIEEAEDGDIAVDMVAAAVQRGEPGYYDFILMDVQMPRMNGYEATKAIRNIPAPEGYHIPIIAMTANAFEEDRQDALAAGMDAHLAKPIDIPNLWATLARFL